MLTLIVASMRMYTTSKCIFYMYKFDRMMISEKCIEWLLKVQCSCTQLKWVMASTIINMWHCSLAPRPFTHFGLSLSLSAPGSCRNGDACCIEMQEGPAGMAVPSDVDAPGSCSSGDAECRCTRVLQEWCCFLHWDAPGSCWNGDADHMATGPLHPIGAVASCQWRHLLGHATEKSSKWW